MSGRSNISWNKNQQRRLNNAVRNANRRVDRIKQQFPELVELLPEKILVSELKKEIKTAQDLNREVNKLNRMTRDKLTKVYESKYGERYTHYTKDELTIQNATLNRAKRREYDKIMEIPVTSRGQPIGMTRGEMGSTEVAQYKPSKINFETLKKGDIDKLARKLNKMTDRNYFKNRDELLRENYIKGIIENFGESTETEDLIEFIKEMSTEDFKEKFYGDQEATIGFLYDPISAQYKLEVIKNIFMGEEMSEKTAKRKVKREGIYSMYGGREKMLETFAKDDKANTAPDPAILKAMEAKSKKKK